LVQVDLFHFPFIFTHLDTVNDDLLQVSFLLLLLLLLYETYLDDIYVELCGKGAALNC